MKHDLHRPVAAGLILAALLINKWTLLLAGFGGGRIDNRLLALALVAIPMLAAGLGIIILLAKPRLTAGYLLYIALLAIIFGYGGSIWFRSWKFYNYITDEHRRGWRGQAHIPDAEFGLKPKPGVYAAHIFPVGADIPMHFDNWGFRVPVDTAGRALPLKRPLLLFLGCSFTYGDACRAEDAFPFLTAQALGGTELNRGVCSWGLAQMMLDGERLLAEFQPDWLVVQYSPWLVERALGGMAPLYYGHCPVPYFIQRDGTLNLQPPPFGWKAGTLPVNDYDGAAGHGRFLSFLSRIGLPLYLYDDFNMSRLFAARMLGILPPCTLDRRAVVRTVYNQLAEAAHKHGSRMVALRLTGGFKNPGDDEWAEILKIPDIITVDAEAALLDSLPATGLDYNHAYKHWRGEPPVMVDGHPNPPAHRIIAGAIVRVMGYGL